MTDLLLRGEYRTAPLHGGMVMAEVKQLAKSYGLKLTFHSTVKSPTGLIEAVNNLKIGTQVIIDGERTGQSGHLFNGKNSKAGVQFLDGQIGTKPSLDGYSRFNIYITSRL